MSLHVHMQIQSKLTCPTSFGWAWSVMSYCLTSPWSQLLKYKYLSSSDINRSVISPENRHSGRAVMETNSLYRATLIKCAVSTNLTYVHEHAVYMYLASQEGPIPQPSCLGHPPLCRQPTGQLSAVRGEMGTTST